MEIIALKARPGIENSTKLAGRYSGLEKLLDALRKRQLPDDVVSKVNHHVEMLNESRGHGPELMKLTGRTEDRIMELLESRMKIVPRNYYRNIWLVLGMAAIGLPLGMSVGLSTGNMAFIGAGLPLGMVFGILIGIMMDKKAAAEGRQLDIEA